MSPVPDGVIVAEVLFRDHAKMVARLAHRLGIPGCAIDDIVQEVFLTAHRKGGYRPGAAAVTTWLTRLTVQAVTAYRRVRRRREAPVEPELAARIDAGRPSPTEMLLAQEKLQLAQRALDRLPDHHRAVFVLAELEGLGGVEIADVLGIPVGTVYSRRHLARKRFTRAAERLTMPSRDRTAAHLRQLQPRTGT